jgi:hypothetical protein
VIALEAVRGEITFQPLETQTGPALSPGVRPGPDLRASGKNTLVLVATPQEDVWT